MLTTFENAERQQRRIQDRERNMRTMDEILKTASSLDASSTPEVMEEAMMASSSPSLAHNESLYLHCSNIDAHEEQRQHRRRAYRKLGSKLVRIGCVALLAIILLVCLLNVKNDDDGLSARYNHLFSMILDWNVTNQTALENKESDVGKALQWLAFEDIQTSVEDVDNVRTRFALAALYYSLYREASPWHISRFWLSAYPVCYWYGIDCSGDEEDPVSLVQSLNLSSNNLIGTIPPEVSLLQTDVTTVDLSFNGIWGRIPRAMGDRLENLRLLYLGPNRLTGEIPESLFGLTALTHLYLDSCQLSGTISSSIGRLTMLQGLALHNNNLDGTIPSSVGELTALRVLNLDQNALSGGIDFIGTLRGLVDLRLGSNRLNGQLPVSLANLHMLEILYLDNNELTGPLNVIDFESMPLLGEVHLQNNRLTGSIPDAMGKLGLLQMLYLDGNHLTGSIPPQMSNIFLEALYLFDNDLTGSIPTILGHLSRLRHVRLDRNHLVGNVPLQLAQLHSLETLYLNNNTLQGNIPFAPRDLPRLVEARFHGNHFSGQVVPCRQDGGGDVSTTSGDVSGTVGTLVELTSDCKRDSVDCPCCTMCYE